MKVGRRTTAGGDTQPARPPRRNGRPGGAAPRRVADGAPRAGRQRPGPADARREARREARRPHDAGAVRRAPQTAPVSRPVERPTRAKNSDQAKARAKARKAKAPKVVRPPLRERIRERVIVRLAGVDLRPRALLARIPFVVLVIGSLGIGLGITLWLSTDAAGRSYQLGNARALNEALTQQKESLERDVLQAESAPALADAARNLGMIPSRDTAHLVQDPAGNWIVVGQPKPAAGVPPPPLNTKLPDPKPPAPPTPPAPVPGPPRPAGPEVPTRFGAPGQPTSPGSTGPEIAVRLPAPGLTPSYAPPVVAPTDGLLTPPGLVLLPVPAVDGLPAAPVPAMPVVPADAAPVAPPAPVPAALPAPGVGR